MNRVKLFLSLLLVVGVLGYGITAESAEAKPKGVKTGVTSAVALDSAGTYCRLKFPSIRPEALGAGAKPTVKDLTGPQIDYYGPCDHDPVGFEEVCKQTAQRRQSDSCE
jgi:hypothetical protein